MRFGGPERLPVRLLSLKTRQLKEGETPLIAIMASRRVTGACYS